MRAQKTVSAALLVSVIMITGCLMVPGPRGGVSFVPILPPLVVLGPEHYYAHEGYHYRYENNNWRYSRSRSGPWAELPRDHYPREVRYRDQDRERGGEYHPENRER